MGAAATTGFLINDTKNLRGPGVCLGLSIRTPLYISTTGLILPTRICVNVSSLSRITIRASHTRIVSREKKDIAKGEDLTLASFQATETGSLLR